MATGTLPLSQATLAQALHTRVEACRRLASGADNQSDTQVALVVGDLDLAAIVQCVLLACEASDRAVLAQWAANFTKTVVLAGNPEKVARRVGKLPIVVSGSIALVGPAPASALSSLRRLLRPLQVARVPQALSGVRVPLSPRAPHAARIIAATEGLGLHDLLISLVHTVAESKLLGTFDYAETLELRLVPELSHIVPTDSYVRVTRTAPESTTLRAHTRVTLSAPDPLAREQGGAA
jgi:hypothetical protein